MVGLVLGIVLASPTAPYGVVPSEKALCRKVCKLPGAPGPTGAVGSPGSPGPPGPTGPAGPATLSLALHQVSEQFGRVQAGTLLTLTASCDAGEALVGGGVVPAIAGGIPADSARIHLLSSGPTTPSAASTAIQTLSQTADLTYTVSALCIAGGIP